MNTAIKTGLVAMLLLAISCKKDNNTIQSSHVTGESSTTDVIANIHETGKYASVIIGTQKWMAKNLDVTRYRNGDKIPHVKDRTEWTALTTGAWCWYKNDSANGAVYGKLYNWFAVNDPRGLAPAGWHVPSDAEWDTLETHFRRNPGGKLKDTGTIEAGTGLWHAPNRGATNETGFTGLPGGWRSGYSDGAFYDIGFDGLWWSSTEYLTNSAWYHFLDYSKGDLYKFYDPKQSGFSVRCLRD